RIDFGLIPELEPVFAQRLLRVDRNVGRRRDRQEAADILLQGLVAKRRAKQRQYCKSGTLRDLLRLEQRQRIAAAEQHHAAAEPDVTKRFQQQADLVLSIEWTKHDEIGDKLVHHLLEIGGTALASNKP